MKAAFRVLDPLYGVALRSGERRRHILEAYCPGILDAFAEIERVTGKRGLYVAKCLDLLSLLDTHKPKCIAEMGSGRTSLIFAAYAKRTRAEYVAFEQDAQWHQLINGLCARLTEQRPVELVNVVPHGTTGARYDRAVPAETDLVYVDGPGWKIRHRHLPAGKYVRADTVAHLNSHRPRLVVLDGGIDTVEAIRPLARGYRFVGGYEWARHFGDVRHGLRFARHTIFSSPYS